MEGSPELKEVCIVATPKELEFVPRGESVLYCAYVTKDGESIWQKYENGKWERLPDKPRFESGHLP